MRNAPAEATIQKVVAAALAAPYVSQDTLAAELGISRSTFNHALTEARRRGLIKRAKWERPKRPVEQHPRGPQFGMIIRINQGLIVRFDAGDAELVAPYNWTASYNASADVWYAATRIDNRLVFMHQMLGFYGGDHINHNGLDNRRRNLRLATQSQQKANQRKFKTYAGKPPISQYRGVTKQGKRWVARCGPVGTNRWIGTFDTEEEAARAFDKRAFQVYGEFAFLNFALDS